MGGHKACGVIVRRSRRGAAYGIEQHPRSVWGAIARRDDLGIGAARIDLGGVEELGSLVGGDGPDDESVGDAGDKVAGADKAGERGHGVAVGYRSVNAAEVVAFAPGRGGLIGAFPGVAAAGDAGVFACGGGSVFRAGGDGGWDGAGHVEAPSAAGILGAELIVRRVSLIICNDLLRWFRVICIRLHYAEAA